MSLPYTLHLGDCLQVLRTIPDNSIDSVVTDPPYGLSFMGKRWDYDVPSVEVWEECLRVLKPGGHLLAFAGTRTQHRMACRIEDAGFELRDMIAWVYGSGFPKSKNLDGDWQGWGTALKPALEPITMARKPLAGTVTQNAEEHGTGALHIDSCRVPSEAMPPNTGAGGMPRRRDDEQRGPGALSQPHPGGRWPANLLHDGSAEVVALFPADAGAVSPVRGTEPTANGFSGSVAYSGMRDRVAGAFHADTGSAARFFYCAKTSRRDRNEGCEEMERRPLHWSSGDANPGSFQSPGTDKTSQNHHPTVKPTELMAYLCRLVTRPGGVVLDPFMGSGSTGKACMREGFKFVGIEREPPYLAISAARISHELARASAEAEATGASAAQLDIFNDTKEPAA
ncbi:site-specific DNA-methyltransferase [Pseudomonas sp. C9-3]|uniref:DNA-methyltransferase n=1 Tax=Pseudomonas sp. C9-3 TaxID=3078264 RepID=UPI0028E38FB2|nr:site-specific DNA-methyltransferase [Pseudomonas sp. C9-3]